MNCWGIKDEGQGKEQASLKAKEEVRFSEELGLKAEKEEQASLKAEEDTRLAEKLRLKAEAGGFCGAGVEI